MTFVASTKLGNYEIIEPLGAGGMGEVYRGRDLKLQRDVAIKVLPEAFARDPERIAWFQREAQILASLNHPHIAAIHDLAQSGEFRFLVLELVDGETLSERLARGPIDIDEAMKIAGEICEALEAAHERGVIHRDLKPANIKLTPNGAVKVLDFGLAKMQADSAPAGSPDLNTMVSAESPGIILGTPAYMSPEHVKGRDLDRASDVWAFGCVLYEMLSGLRTFQGDTVSEIVAAVLTAEPDWKLLPRATPPAIHRLLRRCLQKEHKRRFRDCGDVRIEIEEAQDSAAPDSAATPAASRGRERAVWISALSVTILIAAAAILWPLRTVSPDPAILLEIATPPTTDSVSFAISPDGRTIVFVSTSEGKPRLWLRSLDSSMAKPLEGTDFASYPFWSPDNRSVGFFAEGKLKRIDIDGGSLQTLANAQNSRGGAWNQDGVILFAPSGGLPLFRTTAMGAETTPVTQLDPQIASHGYPRFLPDGHHFFYYAQGSPEASGVYLSNLDGTGTRRLMAADSGAVYVSPGHLFFLQKRALFAQEFDLAGFALKGNPFPVAEEIAIDNEDVAALSASATGIVVYRTGSVSGRRQLVWFDRSGKELGEAAEPLSGPLNPSMSPDGRRVALFRMLSGNVDIWLLELRGGLLTRFTSDPANDVFPIWSADGSRVVFSRNFKGVVSIYSRFASGLGTDELLIESTQSKNPLDSSADGRYLLYRNLDPKTGYDLWALSLNDKKTFSVVQTPSEERDGQFSPDSKWFAYQSNESGRSEIYVQSFPEPAVKSVISNAGGAQVRWRPDGKELFYVALDGRLMAVPIRLSNRGTVEADAPVPLFDSNIGGALQSSYMQQYMVSRDGGRFLMNTVLPEGTLPITILFNWRPKQ